MGYNDTPTRAELDRLHDARARNEAREEARKESAIEKSALLARAEKAERALIRAGFEDKGGEDWKPPINKRNGELQQQVFALEAKNACLKTVNLNAEANVLELEAELARTRNGLIFSVAHEGCVAYGMECDGIKCCSDGCVDFIIKAANDGGA